MARGTKAGVSAKIDSGLKCRVCREWSKARRLPRNETIENGIPKTPGQRQCRLTKKIISPNDRACQKFMLELHKESFCPQTCHQVVPTVCAHRTFNQVSRECSKCKLGKALVKWAQNNGIHIKSTKELRPWAEGISHEV